MAAEENFVWHVLFQTDSFFDSHGGLRIFGYPISAAAEQGHVQVVRLLIRAGANVNVLGGTRGVTALEAAVESRHVPTFRTILDAGADPNVEGTVSYATPVSSHSWEV